MCILCSPPPRMFQDCKNLLQLNPKNKVVDWYLFQDHKIVKNYGSYVNTFLLESFLTPRIFLWSTLDGD